jgi:type II secretory pathway pseudopilin PulG
MNQGYSLIESLLAIGLAAIMLPAIAVGLSLAIKTSAQGESFSHAYALAQEGMEAAIALKASQDSSWNWVTTPVSSPENHYYQPSFQSGEWELGVLTDDPLIDIPPYTRTLTVKEVRRCGLAICHDGWAAIDPYTRYLTVAVSWMEAGQPQSVELNAYVTAY